MSSNNLFETRRKAFLKSTKAIIGSTQVSYTVKVGKSSDNFIVDRVLNVTIVDAYGSITITVPDGIYSGQRLLINYVAEDAVCLDEVVVETDTGVDYDLGELGDYCTLEWIDSATGWVAWNSLETP